MSDVFKKSQFGMKSTATCRVATAYPLPRLPGMLPDESTRNEFTPFSPQAQDLPSSGQLYELQTLN